MIEQQYRVLVRVLTMLLAIRISISWLNNMIALLITSIKLRIRSIPSVVTGYFLKVVVIFHIFWINLVC